MKTKAITQTLCTVFACAILSITSTALAQVPTAYRPGQTISFTIAFDGVDVSKLTKATAYFRLISKQHDEQQGFGIQLVVPSAKSIAPGVFEISTVIPPNIATGTYRFFEADTGTRDVGFSYQDGLTPLTITIDNNDHIVRPAFKGIKETSKP